MQPFDELHDEILKSSTNGIDLCSSKLPDILCYVMPVYSPESLFLARRGMITSLSKPALEPYLCLLKLC